MASAVTTLDAALGDAKRSRFEFWVGPFTGSDSVVVSFSGRERISKPFSFEVRVLADANADLGDGKLLGVPATLTMRASDGPPRVVQGIVAAARPEGHSIGSAHGGKRVHVLRLVPRIWLLKHRTTSKIFQDLAVPDIVKHVLDAVHVKCSDAKLTRKYAKRAYTVQYQESDYAFVKRLLAEEGIFWYVDPPHGAAAMAALEETVVLLDDTKGYPALEEHLNLREGASAGRVGADDVQRFGLDRRVGSTAVLLRDYDFTKPLLDLRADASATSDAAPASKKASSNGANGLNVYDHRGEHQGMEVDKARATLHLEQHRARTAVGEGTSTCPGLGPGVRFHLNATPDLAGDYTITSVLHEGHTPEYTTRAAAGGVHIQHGQVHAARST